MNGVADIEILLEDLEGLNKSFQQDYQYAVYEYHKPQLRVAFEDWKKDVEWPFLQDYVERQPSPFDPMDAENVRTYRKFFNLLGTHVITGVSFGARMICTVWGSNDDDEVNKNFNADVKASFNGLVSGGAYDKHIKMTSQYARFSAYMQGLCSVSGGHQGLADQIGQDPHDYEVLDKYEKWLESSNLGANITGFQTLPIWVLISGADDAKLARRAEDLEKAYEYFVEHPQKHVSKCRLTISSDWGDLNLLTPSAFIEIDPFLDLPNGTYHSSTKIGWQSPESPPIAADVAIEFYITNDGTPIDIDLSHGTAGVSGTGRIEVSIAGLLYDNDRVTDRKINRLPYYNLAVYPWPKVGENDDMMDEINTADAYLELPQDVPRIATSGSTNAGDAARNFTIPEGSRFLRHGSQDDVSSY